MNKKIVLLIHGGAGNLIKRNLSEEAELAYQTTMKEALLAGYAILKNGGNSVDAVEAAIIIMEDSPLFNAGKGSVFNADGKIEMDAAIMNGQNLKAGAVAGISRIKNPVNGAKIVMTKSKHVLMIGKGAEKFLTENGAKNEKASYFFEDYRWKQFQQAKKEGKIKLDHSDSSSSNLKGIDKYGTVGAVALDMEGNLASATSTGGLVNKKPGRIGDSPLIGAGTYANNKTCAVSCTGHGEDFIRLVVAYDISALMEYKKISLKEAAEEVIQNKLPLIKGKGGFIAIDSLGNYVMEFNTNGMFRGMIDEKGKPNTFIYR